MSASDTIQELRELKRHELKASSENDRDFYDAFLADDAVAILPAGQLSKAEVLNSMQGDKAPFSAKRIEDTEVKALGPDAGLVTYKAFYDQQGGGEYAVAATTVYHREADGWKGVLYQQTKLPNG